MNIPNLLTAFRFVLIPVFVLIYFSSIPNAFIWSIVVFLVAGITDVLDGYIARTYNQVTKAGTLLDPLADKLMTLTVLLCLVISDIVPLWVFIIILCKDGLMVVGGISLLKGSDAVVPAKICGKAATFLFYIAIGVMIFDKAIGNYIIYAAIVSAFIAFSVYLKTFINIRSKKQH